VYVLTTDRKGGAMQVATPNGTRTSEQGTTFRAEQIRSFLVAALQHATVADATRELLFEHLVEGKYHPSFVAENLRPILNEVLDVVTREDWAAVAEELTAEARDTLGSEAVR
jgi:hypothetical protein